MLNVPIGVLGEATAYVEIFIAGEASFHTFFSLRETETRKDLRRSFERLWEQMCERSEHPRWATLLNCNSSPDLAFFCFKARNGSCYWRKFAQIPRENQFVWIFSHRVLTLTLNVIGYFVERRNGKTYCVARISIVVEYARLYECRPTLYYMQTHHISRRPPS